jgi:predicted nucleic-acid-binding Zn-ribbon protein
MEIKAKPDSIVVLELEVSNVSDETEKESNMDFVRYKKHLIIYIQPCTYGEFFWKDLTCTPCQIGTYNLTPQKTPGKCALCPKHALCYGGNNLVPQNGYFRLHEYYDLFIPC